jgi:Fe2+ transport system protein FeoA
MELNKKRYCMHFIRLIIKQIYEHFHKRWVRAHFQKFKSFNKCLSYNGIAKLSTVVPGAYRFVAAYSDDTKLTQRLLEMGFVPNEEIVVIRSGAQKSGVMIKIRGSKIALNNEVASKILLKRK